MPAAAADPTLEFLDRLNDPSKWVVRRGVPLFTAHRRKGRDGEEVVVTDGDLPEIAANMAALERDAGVVGRITPGHVQAGRPETDQPPLYGFMRNPRVGPFGPSRKPAVLVDNYYFPEHAAAADRLPYRSAEYYPAERVIRGMALLLRDPFLDMGVVTYTGGGRAYQYAMGGDMADDPNKPNPAPNPNPSPNPGPAPASLSPDEEALAQKFWAYFCQKFNLQAGGQTPNPVPMDKGTESVQYQQVKAELDRANTRIQALEKERDQAVCERLVGQLEAEGYMLDRAFEVKELMGRDDGGRQAYLKNLRARYSKVPADRMIQVTRDRVEGGDDPNAPKELTRDQMDEALAYQDEHKCSWAKAREAILSGKK